MAYCSEGSAKEKKGDTPVRPPSPSPPLPTPTVVSAAVKAEEIATLRIDVPSVMNTSDPNALP